MSLVAVAAAKGAPGVTTAATALAAVWPATAILADCDPSGGDIALRLRDNDGRWLVRDRGIVGLAAAIRTQADDGDLQRQVQTAAGGVPVLVGVDSPAQAARIGESWSEIAEQLATLPGMDVIADCGRLLPELTHQHIVARADALLLVTTPSLEGVAHLRHLVEALSESRQADAIHVAVVADADKSQQQVADVTVALDRAGCTGVRVHALARDASAAAALAGVPTRGLDRSALVSSARTLAAELCDAAHSKQRPSADRVLAEPLPVEVG